MLVKNNLLVCSADKPQLVETVMKCITNEASDKYNRLILDLGGLLTSMPKFVSPTDLNTCLFSPSEYDIPRPHAIRQIVQEVCQCIKVSSRSVLVIINNVELLPRELVAKLMSCAKTHRCSVRFVVTQLYSQNMCWQYRSSTHVTETIKTIIGVSNVQKLSRTI